MESNNSVCYVRISTKKLIIMKYNHPSLTYFLIFSGKDTPESIASFLLPRTFETVAQYLEPF